MLPKVAEELGKADEILKKVVDVSKMIKDKEEKDPEEPVIKTFI